MDILLYVSIIVFSIAQSAFVKCSKGERENGVVFNAIKALSALLLFCVLCLRGIGYDTVTLLCGASYGVSLAISMYAGYQALLCGPMALTGMIVSFSVVIPVVAGVVFFEEKITLFKGIGLAFLLLALYFSGKKRRKMQKESDAVAKKGTSTAWALYVLCTFLANGVCSVLQKVHQQKRTGQYSCEFMLFAMLACCAIYCIITLVKNPPKAILQTSGKKFAFFSGMSQAIVNYFTLILAGSENATVLFPTISIGTIFGTSLCGVLLFREKATVRQLFALVFGVSAIVFLKL